MQRPRPTIRRLAVWLGLCLALASAAAGTGAQGAAELHQSYDLAPGGSVSVSNVSGYIRVTSWNENRVQVDAVKRGRRGEDLGLVEIQVTARPDRVEVRTLYPRGRSNNVSVDYDVKVPRTTVLNSIDSTSGEVTVTGPVARLVASSTSGDLTAREVAGDANLRGTSGGITAMRVGGVLTAITTSGDVQVDDAGAQLTARSTSGSVHASRVKGDATVSSSSGEVRLANIGGRVGARAVSAPVTVTDAGGDVTAESMSDAVRVEKARGRVVASTISGSIVIRGASEGVRASGVSGSIEVSDTQGRIEAGVNSGSIALQNVESRDVQAKSHSGGVSFRGRLFGDGRYIFESFSSDIVLHLPADSGFDLTARSVSGGIETDFPIRLAPGTPLGGGRDVRGTAGGGGAQVHAAGYSGGIFIKKEAAARPR